MPEEILAIASGGEFDEFDLNEFFKASGEGLLAAFKHKDEVQKWLNVIRGDTSLIRLIILNRNTAPFPLFRRSTTSTYAALFLVYADVAACNAMANLLSEKHMYFGMSMIRSLLPELVRGSDLTRYSSP